MKSLFYGYSVKEEIPTGSWRANIHDVYRTNDGNACFTFHFIDVGTHYEIDIVKQPSYGSRATDMHSTHRLPSDRSDASGYRICLGDDSQANSLDNARRWAAAWAEGTWTYIHTGSFPNRK